jgi:protoporphyrin/coproporphyrin ferrochelatase
MKYIGNSNFDHSRNPRIGVLLTNLGTPEAPQRGPLRRYLKQFLSDPRVVEVPRLLWWFILNGVILNIRPSRSAAAYRTVWTEQGSPLMLHTRAQAQKLQVSLQQQWGDSLVVEYAMRYGQPSISSAVQALMDAGVERLLVLPLYPQYSGPTTASTFDALAQDFAGRRFLPELRFATSYHDHPAYIAALAQSIRRHWDTHGRADKLILSYHGEPQRCLDKGDPYFCHCHKTSRLVAEQLQLEDDAYLTTFQSRFGREPWLQPYTDEILKQLPAQGVGSVEILCPGFSSDCLETLEEIAVENQAYFLEAGGDSFQYIACLNSSAAHIDALQTIVLEKLQGWQPPIADRTQTQAHYQQLNDKEG